MDQIIASATDSVLPTPPASRYDSEFEALIAKSFTTWQAKEMIYNAIGVVPKEIVFVNAEDYDAGAVPVELSATFAGSVLGLYGFRLITCIGVPEYDALSQRLGFCSDVPVVDYAGSTTRTLAVAVGVTRFFLAGFRAGRHSNAVQRLRRVMESLLLAVPVGEIAGKERGTWLVVRR